jgi:hypothetical protein
MRVMSRRAVRSRAFVLVAAFLVLVPLVAASAQSPALGRRDQEEFLRTARIVSSAPTSKGVTKPARVTLSNGTLTHDAQFQAVDEQRAVSMRTGPGGKPELQFRDSWRYNVAAPRVAELLGIGDMVPVSVERTWRGKAGALTWWVDDVIMDEEERRKTNAEPPDRDAWNRQNNVMLVFTELVYDTDRNQGNILIVKDGRGGWRLVMIDFTRAFRPWKETRSPLNVLRRCDRALFAAMRALAKPELRKATATYLTEGEVDGLLARRDLIVKHFETLIARLGEDQVIY